MLEFCYRKKTRQKDNKGEGIMNEKKVKMGKNEIEEEIVKNKTIKKITIDMIKSIDDYKALKIIYEIVTKYYTST